VAVGVEGGEAIDELPNLFVCSVEDVRAVEVNLDAFFGSAAAVAAWGLAFFEDEHASACVGELTCDSTSPQPRTSDYGIVFHYGHIIPNNKTPFFLGK